MKTRNFIKQQPGFKTGSFKSGKDILRLNFNADRGHHKN